MTLHCLQQACGPVVNFLCFGVGDIYEGYIAIEKSTGIPLYVSSFFSKSEEIL